MHTFQTLCAKPEILYVEWLFVHSTSQISSAALLTLLMVRELKSYKVGMIWCDAYTKFYDDKSAITYNICHYFCRRAGR